MKYNNLSIIVAIDINGAIGFKNKLLWHIPEDLKYFKSLTVNNTVVMGKNTWLSLPIRPLPERENIIISTTLKKIKDVLIFSDFNEALNYCIQKNNECFFIGGEQIYRQAINFVSKLYITRIMKKAVEADAFFPLEELKNFDFISENKIFSIKAECEVVFETYKRK